MFINRKSISDKSIVEIVYKRIIFNYMQNIQHTRAHTYTRELKMAFRRSLFRINTHYIAFRKHPDANFWTWKLISSRKESSTHKCNKNAQKIITDAFQTRYTINTIATLTYTLCLINIVITSTHRKKGHSCFKNMFSFNMEILKWDYIALIEEKYNCLNNCLLEWSHFI